MIKTVEIKLRLMDLDSVCCGYGLYEDEIQLAYEKLDKPDYRSDGFTENFICTSPAAIKVVEIKRKKLAEKISKLLTESIMEQLESKDTIIGYPVKIT